MKHHKFYWLPNALTLFRILAVPVLMWGIISVGNNTQSLANAPLLLILLFLLCAATDFLDGFLARRWKLVSDFGRMIDPIADKLLVAGCLIAFMISTGALWSLVIPAVTIVFRDIFISGTREHAANAGLVLSPTKLAKWKTAAEMLALLLLLLSIAANSLLPISENLQNLSIYTRIYGIALLWLAAFLSVFTGLHYVKETFK